MTFSTSGESPLVSHAPIPSTGSISKPLSLGHFKCVAEGGFGDGSNSYAYSACWYDEHLYIGSNRDILPLLILRLPFEAPFRVQPVPVPRDYTGLDLRGQIWRYNPRTKNWQRVYQAPMLPGYQGRLVPEAFGFRAMAVFQGKSDERPAIYTLPFVGRNAMEAVALRSADGLTFHRIPPPSVPGMDEVFGSFRSITPFKGRLFASPSSSKPRPEASGYTKDGREIHVTLANTSRASAVMCSDDPASGNWEMSSLPLFGDRTNSSIFDMTQCGEYLYSGAFNLRYGFQIYRTKAEGPAPHDWELVLDLGADRGALNQSAISLAEFQGNLYVGTCIQNSGYDPLYQVGPAAGEVLRIYPDKTWDLVVGEPRMTRQGLKIPTSGLRAGFDNPLAGYIWRMGVHDGTLYVGTCDNSSFVPFSKGDMWPDHSRFLLDSPFLDRYMSMVGGCEVWRTTDGDGWTPITRNGFGNPYNLGVRTIISTPVGLFIGTANPFGPRVAVRGLSGHQFADNQRGGTEIWHGALQHADQNVDGNQAVSPERISITRAQHVEANGHGSSNGAVESASIRNGEQPNAVQQEASYQYVESLSSESDVHDPLIRLSMAQSDLVGLSETIDDELCEYFGSGLQNVGYWSPRSTTPHAACRVLIRELYSFLPAELRTRDTQSVLCVANSPLEAKAELAKLLPDITVEAIASGDLHKLPNDSFDVALWIEAFGGKNRLQILRELSQRLRPGGCLLLCGGIAGDISSHATAGENAFPDWQQQLDNEFVKADLHCRNTIDVTAETWLPFFNHSRNYWLVKLLLLQIDAAKQASIFAALPGGQAGFFRYLFVCASKTEENAS